MASDIRLRAKDYPMNPSTPFLITPETGHERIAPIHETAALAVDVSDLQFGWDTAADPILDIKALQIAGEERVFIEGPSGSGKSTLLSLLAGVMTAQKGAVSVLGQRVDALSGAQRDRFRADHIGFIFQMFNLVPLPLGGGNRNTALQGFTAAAARSTTQIGQPGSGGPAPAAGFGYG